VKKKIIALIPARYESKTIKRKNFIKLNGKLLINYTIEEALKSKLIDKIMISTDNFNYLKKFTPYKKNKFILRKRPKKISGSKSKMIEVINDSLNLLKKIKYNYDYIVLLQPTSPLKKSKHIDQAIKRIISLKANTLISVYKVDDNHPARMYFKKGDYLKAMFPKLTDTNRQELPFVYHRNGAIYIFKKNTINNKTFYSKKICFYEMPLINSINIDNKIDWMLCETILKNKL
jgi:CMP-N-acetylneuraminic acid synthetase